jgi:N-acetylneuraminic acid mutarotase
MLVWGGGRNWDPFSDGGRYDPVADRWSDIAQVEPSDARFEHSAVWTGTEMLVWGGLGRDAVYLDSGGRYDPVADRWTPMSTSGAPSARTGHRAFWTGSEMLIWGGMNTSEAGPDQLLSDGARYDPDSDTWSPITANGAPVGELLWQSVWTGAELIVWGREVVDGMDLRSIGGRYDPTTDAWTPMAEEGSLLVPFGAAWSGEEMLVWGADPFDLRVIAYDPAADTWREGPAKDSLPPSMDGMGTWAEERLLLWGGFWSNPSTQSAGTLAFGALYDPSSDSWESTGPASDGVGRSSFASVWTGEELIVWAGGDGSKGLATGVAYRPFDE